MIIFIEKKHLSKGIHRFLEGFLCNDKYHIVPVENIRETNDYEAKNGIFAGFLPIDLKNNISVKNKYYVFCSPLGQLELSDNNFYSIEFNILNELLYCIKENIIKNAITGSESLSYHFSFIKVPHVKHISDKFISFNNTRSGYGFLGNNFRKHRNVFNQVTAISKLKPKEPIIVQNANAYIAYSKTLDCEFISKDLSTDELFYNEIKNHILGFQCSWSEAFNYIAYEYAFMGVPCIVSPCIEWYPIDECIVNNIDSPKDIFETAQNLLNDNSHYKWCSDFLVDWSKEYNEEQEKKLFDLLNKLVGDS